MYDVRGDFVGPTHGTTPAIICTMDDVRGDFLGPPHGTTQSTGRLYRAATRHNTSNMYITWACFRNGKVTKAESIHPNRGRSVSCVP